MTQSMELRRTGATMPWARLEATESNRLRLTVWEGAQEDAREHVLLLSKQEADELQKAIDLVSFNYLEDAADV